MRDRARRTRERLQRDMQRLSEQFMSTQPKAAAPSSLLTSTMSSSSAMPLDVLPEERVQRDWSPASGLSPDSLAAQPTRLDPAMALGAAGRASPSAAGHASPSAAAIDANTQSQPLPGADASSGFKSKVGARASSLSPWWQKAKRQWGMTPLSDSIMPPTAGGFEDEAKHLFSRQRVRRSQRIVHVAVGVVALLLLWAALAKVDEVTRGDARVISSRQLQVVQSLDGGVVSEIRVREGQLVQAGELLLRIDETRATSGVRESAAQGVALRARVARLRALSEGTAFKPPASKDTTEAAVIDAERRLFESKRNELQTTLSVVRQQMAQRQNELAEANARRSSAQRAMESAQQELNQTRPLIASGAVSQVEVLRLEREVSRNRGEVEQAAAQAARASAAIGESQRKQQEVELAFRNEAGRDLAETSAKLSALNEGAVALADRVDKAQVRSPVRGRVQRLLANTVGGVVTPGKDIVEIVPLDDTLVLEARVSPRDIAFIRPDQPAMVKFTAYDYSIYGGLDAKVENISPDSVVDEKGNAYYLVRVRTTQPTLGKDLPIMPGMTAEVDVLTGRKSVLSYLLKPVLKVQANALRER